MQQFSHFSPYDLQCSLEYLAQDGSVATQDQAHTYKYTIEINDIRSEEHIGRNFEMGTHNL